MGNCIQGCYECIHSIGSNAKFIRCKYCGEKKWRGHRSADYVREQGCVICRYKNKMSSSKINVYFRKKPFIAIIHIELFPFLPNIGEFILKIRNI